MRRLLPTVQEPVDLLELYGAPPQGRGRPGVRLNMISSADGATAVAGRSGGLGGPGDREVFTAIRAAADVVLVAAGTVRAEGYGAIGIPLAVVTRSCNLDWESPLFSEPGPRPLVVTTEEAPAAALERADEVAELCLTLAPALVAGPAKRVAVAPTETDPNQLELLSMCEQDGSLFLRYAVHRDHDSA